ncbi:ATP-binding protein [Kitasatospora mediocidica]|uniref:ATP-binding protein n=1 Tax=Kitasatospora mediocidica TaxID=58352 RepID=UPI00068B205C|nr:ATP-binding protein [Kitasatospora mediocidica]
MIDSVSCGRLPAEADDHIHRLDAHLVATDALMTTLDNIEATIEAKAMMCAFGPAGHGKTMSVNSALRQLAPDTTVRLELRSGPTVRDIRYGLFQVLGLPGEPPGRPIEFDTLLKETLSERFRVLVCDEAQWMGRSSFEYWRHLWDDRHTDIAVIFAGGDNCYKVLKREPILASRIFIWQKFKRIPEDEVTATLPAFHRMWSGVRPDLIRDIDRAAAHGNFRNWATVTKHLQQGMKKMNLTEINDDLVNWVYSRIGGM